MLFRALWMDLDFSIPLLERILQPSGIFSTFFHGSERRKILGNVPNEPSVVISQLSSFLLASGGATPHIIPVLLVCPFQNDLRRQEQ
jgi:hypothetical protein